MSAVWYNYFILRPVWVGLGAVVQFGEQLNTLNSNLCF